MMSSFSLKTYDISYNNQDTVVPEKENTSRSMEYTREPRNRAHFFSTNSTEQLGIPRQNKQIPRLPILNSVWTMDLIFKHETELSGDKIKETQDVGLGEHASFFAVAMIK